MKKIIVSLSVIAAVAAVAVGGTVAFFSDTETSTGNTFTAGSIDLKVDSECHYYNITGFDDETPIYSEVEDGCTTDNVSFGNWTETDLQDGVHKFFNFEDIKPGDKGEDTISLHVYDNDAWGKITMSLTEDLDNSCTEPEGEDTDESCTVTSPEGTTPGAGELLKAMVPYFSMWLDQGETPGFQGKDEDDGEGDNVWQQGEPRMPLGALRMISDFLIAARDNEDCENTPSDGHNNYEDCHGLADDGRMVGSTTYYFGLDWSLPWSTGNEVQTDSLGGTMSFMVEQHRNNPVPFD